ncbi:MAG: metal-dependent transcriptional regulator [Cyclobacteriaceae bacterium]|nr:metal-dependent transcriptional regulator [Cyclobacteriaceae bacterium]UYN85426.1 MAG: metal-dependent transcriptional regulator [Cyclobacteriaceae bacterium]
MLSLTEENYLKAIYHLSDGGLKAVLTNEIAESIQTRPASVTDMVKKLAGKNLITYEKYYGVNVTKLGKSEALSIIRKHRLWETFLVEKLGFDWGQVHDVAEQLEHIQSALLIEKLDEFLGFPAADPHGHPIPDKNGKFHVSRQIPLVEATGKKTKVRAVRNSSPSFLDYLSKIGIYIGATVQVLERLEFDGSLEIAIDGKKRVFISKEAGENILVTE